MHYHSAFPAARRVFVFGATGFLGQHTVQELLQVNAEVCGLVRSASPVVDQLPLPDRTPFHIVRGHAQDGERCIRALAAFEPDVILHLASASSSVDAAIFAACRVAAPDVPIIVPIAASTHRRRETLQRYAGQFNRRVLFGQFPMLFGEGDRNGNHPVPRLLRSEIDATRPTFTSVELHAECLYVKDAARGLSHLIELSLDLTIPNATAVTVAARPSVTLADVLAEVQSTPVPPRLHTQADDTAHLSDMTAWQAETPLDEAVRRTRAWLRHGSWATTEYPAAQRFAA